VTRSVRITNFGDSVVNVIKAMSASVDFDFAKFDLLQLPGAWARERHLERIKIGHGIHLIESRKGNSSHDLNPFFALVSPVANETIGDVYGFNPGARLMNFGCHISYMPGDFQSCIWYLKCV
jgi:alpha-galactosidase